MDGLFVPRLNYMRFLRIQSALMYVVESDNRSRICQLYKPQASKWNWNRAQKAHNFFPSMRDQQSPVCFQMPKKRVGDPENLFWTFWHKMCHLNCARKVCGLQKQVSLSGVTSLTVELRSSDLSPRAIVASMGVAQGRRSAGSRSLSG